MGWDGIEWSSIGWSRIALSAAALCYAAWQHVSRHCRREEENEMQMGKMSSKQLPSVGAQPVRCSIEANHVVFKRLTPWQS